LTLKRIGKITERRHEDRIALVERRKGKLWMYGEIACFAALMLYLMLLL
jgi:hypothetical protein